MAMRRFTTVAGADQRLNALVRSLYEIPERGARRVTKEAADAILEANPHLEGLDRIPKGTPIVVPELASAARSRRDEEPAVADSVEALLEQGALALNQAREALRVAHDRRVEEVKESVGVASSRLFRAAVGEHEAARRADAMIEGAEAELEEAEQTRRAHEAALEALEADLKAFEKVVRTL